MIGEPQELPTLDIFDPAGNTHFGNLVTEAGDTWQHTTRRRGGNWSAAFELTRNRDRLIELFYNGLNYLVTRRLFSQDVWSGFIAEMTLTYKRATYKRSILDTAWRINAQRSAEPFANAVRVKYQRTFDSLVVNPSCESAAWAAYNGATVTRDATYVTDGSWGCKVVVADTAIRGATIQAAIAVAAGRKYDVTLDVNVTAGSWRISCNRADTDESLCFWSSRGATGILPVKMEIPETNQYAGNVDFRITAEAAAGTLYADNAIFREQTQNDADTGWLLDAASIAQYGRIENIVQMQEMSAINALALANQILRTTAWPRTQLPGRIDFGGAAATDIKLHINILGLIHSYRQLTTLQGASTKSAVISALAPLSSRPNKIAIMPNTEAYSVVQSAGTASKIWTVMDDVARSGDVASDYWRCGVFGRSFVYEPVSPAIEYALQNGELQRVDKSRVNPWLVQPGLIALADLPEAVKSATGRTLDVPNRALVDEVSYTRGRLTLTLA